VNNEINKKSLKDDDAEPSKNKKRVKRRSQDVITLFTPSDNCKENLETYIQRKVVAVFQL